MCERSDARGGEPPRRYCDICPLRKRSLLPTLSPMTQPPRLLHAPLPSEVETEPRFVVSLSNDRPLSESVGFCRKVSDYCRVLLDLLSENGAEMSGTNTSKCHENPTLSENQHSLHSWTRVPYACSPPTREGLGVVQSGVNGTKWHAFSMRQPPRTRRPGHVTNERHGTSPDKTSPNGRAMRRTGADSSPLSSAGGEREARGGAARATLGS